MNPLISYQELLDFFRESRAYEQPSANAKREWGTELVTNCGMFLSLPPLRNYGYSCTPVNSLQFARTGGDGVHYSFLANDGAWSEGAPVVMTCPNSHGWGRNVIVGENLGEFLRLGLCTGYFSLAHLSQNRDFATDSFVTESLSSGRMASRLEPEEVTELESLAHRFQLTPWVKVAERLEELQQKYLPGLKLPAEE